MNKKIIQKYIVPVQDLYTDFTVEMPLGCTVKSVSQLSSGDLAIWAESYKTSCHQSVRKFRVFLAGFPIPVSYEYIGHICMFIPETDSFRDVHLYEQCALYKE